jgi:Domain of unknown function (DUF1707)
MSELDDAGGPMDPQQAAVRVGTAEREAAVAALNAHREAGRLTAQEYEDRSVRAGQAAIWGDLGALFADLPEPRPNPAAFGIAAAPAPWSGGSAAGTATTPPPSSSPVPAPAGRGLTSERWAATAVGAAPILAVILFFVTGSWLWFLAIPLVGIFFYGGRRRGR